MFTWRRIILFCLLLAVVLEALSILPLLYTSISVAKTISTREHPRFAVHSSNVIMMWESRSVFAELTTSYYLSMDYSRGESQMHQGPWWVGSMGDQSGYQTSIAVGLPLRFIAMSSAELSAGKFGEANFAINSIFLIINLIFVAVLMVLVVLIWRCLLVNWRVRHGQCPHCGYLKASGVNCPECGQTYGGKIGPAGA